MASFHVFKLFAYAHQAHRHVLGRYARNGADLVVGQSLEPQQHQGAVEGAQLVHPFVEHLYLSGVSVVVLIQIDAHVEAFGLRLPFLLAFGRYAGVKADAVNPRV